MSADLAIVAPKVGQMIRLLASDKDGEVIAAVRAIGRTLRSVGEDFHSLARIVESRAPVETSRSDCDWSWRTRVEWCLVEVPQFLSPKESAFLNDMLEFEEPTEKQWAWIERIFARERRRAS